MDYKKETIEILQKVNDDSLLEFFYRFIARVQKILGHSSLAMTADLYAHVLPNTKQQEMQQIENGFIGVAVL